MTTERTTTRTTGSTTGSTASSTTAVASDVTFDLRAVLAEMGQATSRLNAINACEANAGNISVTVPTTDAVAGQLDEIFPDSEPYALPTDVPALRGRTVLVSGSQQRLREIEANPTAIVGAVVIDAAGGAVVRSAPDRAFARPTSESNSHLAVHNDYLARSGQNDHLARTGHNDHLARTGHTGIHAVVHAHAPYTTTLSHQFAGRFEAGADPLDFARMIMRWEPELVVHVPHGIGFLPYEVPGSKKLEEASVAGLRVASIVAWAKHGVLARSEKGPLGAVDLIEFIETGARFELDNQRLGNVASGLTDAEIAEIITSFGVEASVY